MGRCRQTDGRVSQKEVLQGNQVSEKVLASRAHWYYRLHACWVAAVAPRSTCFIPPIDGAVLSALNFSCVCAMVSPPMRFFDRVTCRFFLLTRIKK